MQHNYADTEFLPPVCLKDDRGNLRHAGFEFEYANVPIALSIAALQREYGGVVEMINPYHYKLKESHYGTFTVMIDFQFLANSILKSWVKKAGLEGVLDEEMIDSIEQFVAAAGESVVPYEVTTPPLPMDNLKEAQKIKEILRHLGARGTKASPVYAFGMHINPQVRSLNIEKILSEVKAFFVLYDFLLEWIDPDLTRRITPYINPFNSEYRILVLSEDYKPDMQQFIDDYLLYNPTRNRALDLLPLLCYIDEARVKKALPDEKIGKRPTYHYRLCDSRVDEETWCVCQGWNSWVLVERLADDSASLTTLSTKTMDYLLSPFSVLEKVSFMAEVRLWVEKNL